MKKWQNRLVVMVLFTALMHLPLAAPALGQSISGAEVAARLAKARAGDAQEQFLLGVMYEKGKGVAQDTAEAAKWYRKAADQDHIRAQLSLGNLYDKGVGVEQSYKEAMRWYSRAAILGNAEAMFFLGSIYYNGDGLDKDLAASLVWLQGAAERNYPPAKAALAQVTAEIAAQGGSFQAKSSGTPPPDLAIPPKPIKKPSIPTPATPAVLAPPPKPDTVKVSTSSPLHGYAVQIGSFKTRAQAQTHWQRLQKKMPDLFAGATSTIYKKQFESGRVFYRLNAAVFPDNAVANQTCTQYKAKGTDCIVVKY